MSSPDTHSPLSRTPLADWHQANGGRMVDFAGWSMPVQYGSIVEEHNATRNAVGLFDVSHMGRLTIQGPAAESWLDGLVTRRVAGMPIGRVRYSLVCNETGGVLDDILVTRVAEDRFDVVVNASNRAKLLDWFASHAMADANLTDRTEATAMIAVQGPGAVEMVKSLRCSLDVKQIGYYWSLMGVIGGPASRLQGSVACAISRTGYTGEDGFELVVESDFAALLWQTLIDSGAKACGLASRDTLRLEAGMPLYGHELDEQTTPIQAGLRFAVNFTKPEGARREFIGQVGLERQPKEDDWIGKTRVGLRVEGKRAPREGYAVLDKANSGAEQIGVITSGAPSPTLGYPIAMAYVNSYEFENPGTELVVDIRGQLTKATVVPLPFYKRT